MILRQKFHGNKTIIQPERGCQKMIPNSFLQQHILVDFKYLSFCGSSGLEIFHTCNQHKNGLMPKNSW